MAHPFAGPDARRGSPPRDRDDRLLLEVLEMVERVEHGLHERRIDRSRTREVIDLVEGLLGAPSTKDRPGS